MARMSTLIIKRLTDTIVHVRNYCSFYIKRKEVLFQRGYPSSLPETLYILN
jgi:hypothetical protein